MDSYGIGNGVKGAVSVYFRSSRRTGRTSQLVDNVRNGDRIVFKDPIEADRARRLCLDKGVSIKTLVVNPARPEDLFDKTRGDASSRLLFDHSWV